MRVGLALEIDPSIFDRVALLTELQDSLLACFQDKTYGPDVESIAVGIILKKPSATPPRPLRKFRYLKHLELKLPKMELNNVIEYAIRPDFEMFSQLSAPLARAYIARLLIESLDVLDEHRKKFPNFTVERFKEDFAACLRT